MNKRFHRLVRRIMPLCSAGLLFQAAGCDPNAILAGVATSIANNLITSFVFGAFNIIP